MVQLNNISVSLQGLVIFHQLNIHLESGISYLLEGRNGSGKTTLLNLLAGKIQPRTGAVQYDFIDESFNWDERHYLRKKNIHFIPSHALHELIGGREIFYQQRYYSIGDNPSPTTVRDYLGDRLQHIEQLQLPDSFQLQHLLDLELIRLSNGQVKKIIILKQLLDGIPKILLLDYPFEGLDSVSRIALSLFLDHLANFHHIQLIVADHEHIHLPNVLTQRIQLHEGSVKIGDRRREHSTLSIKDESSKTTPRKETEAIVDMREVSIRYGKKVIIDKLNWTIYQGDRWALTGQNGSGKTTLFSLIYADHPTAYSEKVFLFGKRRGSGESIWDIKRRISYLGPEQFHFLDQATGQLTVRAYLEKVNTPREKLDQLINAFELTPLLPQQLCNLSHGQLQLVLLLRVLLAPRELLLLDEPFQFLDPLQKMRVSNFLHANLDESTTLVLITHNEAEVDFWTHQRLKL